jgi:hypothetical protein
MSEFVRVAGRRHSVDPSQTLAVSTTNVSEKERAAVVEWKLDGRYMENPTDGFYNTPLVKLVYH